MQDQVLAALERRKLYVSNLPSTFTPEILQQEFEQFGQVQEATILQRQGRDGRLSGFVTFVEPDSATVANDQMQAWHPDGSQEKVTVKFADAKGKQGTTTQQSTHPNPMTSPITAMYPALGQGGSDRRSPPYKLYVSNLPPASDEEYVRCMFGVYGEVLDCFIINGAGRGGRRSSFVTFQTQEQAENAITSLSDAPFAEDADYRLTVRWAEKKGGGGSSHSPQAASMMIGPNHPVTSLQAHFGGTKRVGDDARDLQKRMRNDRSDVVIKGSAQTPVKLYVSNIEEQIDEQGLTTMFAKYGEVLEASFHKGRGRENRKSGFVWIRGAPSAMDAINGLRGQITVRPA